MVELISFIIPILILDFIITGLITVVLYKRYQMTRIKAVALAVVFFFIDTALALIEFGFVLYNQGDLLQMYLDPNQPFQIIFSALGILGAGTFLLFINYYLREEISLTHVAVIFSILFTFLTYSFMTLYLRFNGIEYPSISIEHTPISFEFLPAVMITYLLIVTYPQLINIYRTTDLQKQKRVVLGLLVGIFFYYVNTATLITLSNQLDIEGTNYIIMGSLLPRASVIIGDIIILTTYARIPAAYLHDQKIEKLLVISQSGLLLYSQDFITSSQMEDGDVLLSGGLSALSSMLAETINVSELESIEFKEKEVMIEHQPKIGYFLITNRPSKFLKNALVSVGMLFPNIANLDDKPNLNKAIPQETKLTIKLNEIFGV